MSAPISLTVPADMSWNLHGHADAAISIPVSSSGTTTVVVRGSTGSYTAKAKDHPAASWVQSITPKTLTLHPGQHGTFTLHVHVPAGTVADPSYLNFIATAAPAGSSLNKVGAGVGGTLTLSHPGHAVAASAPPTPAPSGSAAGLVLGLVLGVIGLALVITGLTVHRHRHHPGHHA